MELTLNEYQQKAMSTCMPTCNNFAYMMLNLVGEVGEFSSKVAKGIRHGNTQIGEVDEYDQEVEFYPNKLYTKTAWGETVFDVESRYNELKKEAGDILWQLSGLCKVMGWTLEEVAQQNLDKLASRKERGVIDGNGDNR